VALPKLSKFPLGNPFEEQDATTPFSEVGLRLVANFYSETPVVIGSATVMCGHLLVTAKHVFNDILLRTRAATALEVDASISAVQILPNAEYVIWDVIDGTADPISDLALLRLSANPGRSHPDSPYYWKQPRINPFSPDVGETVAAFGYANSTIKVSKNDAGGNHIDLRDKPIVAVGQVREIFEMRRDQRLPFPCYQVSARFDGGMSGGPVFDETGSLCGLVCSNLEGSHLDGEPVSYVTTLWPLFRLTVGFDQSASYLLGDAYPAIELVRNGIIHVSDVDRLERWFSEHIPPASL
jgi:hypothetical protein